MPDYSEFPTTPTAWQEAALRDEGWQEVHQLPTEDLAPAPRRSVDRVALAAGVVFSLLAIVLMTGVRLAGSLFGGGGILWLVLIGLGVLLLVGELRKARRRR